MPSGPAAQEEIFPTMRLHPTNRSLWLLPLLLTGCTSTMGSRVGVTANPSPKTIAVVGDHPLPAATGEAGLSREMVMSQSVLPTVPVLP